MISSMSAARLEGTTSVYFMLFFLHNAASFSNLVQPACDKGASECVFHLSLDYLKTMVHINSTTKRGTVVVEKDGKLYRKIPSNTCATTVELTQDEEDNVVFGDGHDRLLYAFNRQVPGPSIVVYEGTEVIVKVENMLLNEQVSVHWHGLHMKDAPWMDGVAGITQCGIAPLTSFMYRFTPHITGTYWYHTHVGNIRQDGAFGAFIVLEREVDDVHLDYIKTISDDSATDIDGDYVLFVQDYLQKSASALEFENHWSIPAYTNDGDEDGCLFDSLTGTGVVAGSNPFYSALINGKGMFEDYNAGMSLQLQSQPIKTSTLVIRTSPLLTIKGCENREFRFEAFLDVYLTGQHYSGTDIPEIKVPRETLRLEANRLYRIRIINSGVSFAFQLSIDEHDFHVISADGRSIYPVAVDSVIVHNGERADVLLLTNEKEGIYTIRSETLETVNFGGFVDNFVLGSLIIGAATDDKDDGGSSERRECKIKAPCRVFNCEFGNFKSGTQVCISLNDIRNTPTVMETQPMLDDDEDIHEVFLNFQVSFARRSMLINNKKFIWPTSPPLITPYNIDDVITPCSDTNGGEDCTHLLKVSLGSTVQLVLTGLETTTSTLLSKSVRLDHPVHIHGYHVSVLKVGLPEFGLLGLLKEQSTDIKCIMEDGVCIGSEWSDASWSNGNIPGLNLQESVLKDTVVVPSGGYIVARIRAENPGFWLLHCHEERHIHGGMVMLLQVGERENMLQPPTGMPRDCGTFDWVDSSKNLLKAHLQPNTEETLCSDTNSTGHNDIMFILVIVVTSIISTVSLVFILSVTVWGVKRMQNAGYHRVDILTYNGNPASEKRKLLGM